VFGDAASACIRARIEPAAGVSAVVASDCAPLRSVERWLA
jgi:hypothetical protein